MTKVLSAAEFAESWGRESLARLSVDLPQLPETATSFLREAGLPKRVRMAYSDDPHEMSFLSVSKGIGRFTDSGIHGGSFPREWETYWMIGEETFSNGGAGLVIVQETGVVLSVDVEIDNPVRFLNSSVAHLASTLLHLVTWSRRHGSLEPGSNGYQSAMNELTEELRQLDSAVFDQPHSYWPIMLYHLEEVGPRAFQIHPG
jgi:hypothetical protein